MLQFEEQKFKLNEYREGMAELKDALSYDELKEKIAKLESEASKEGFWDDLENSQKVLKETSHLKGIVEKYDSLNNDYNDLFDLIAMADEEEDLSMLDDVIAGVESFINSFEDMRLTPLLSGEYDNAEEIVAKYNELKKKLDDAGVKILDGIDFENIIM